MKYLILLIGLVGASPFISNAQTVDDPFTADVKKYFRAAKFDAMYLTTIEQIIDALTNIYPEVKPETWTDIRKQMKTRSIEELWDLLAPVYKKHFTHEDIKAILAFYNSPAGIKLASKTMLLTDESMIAVESWAKTISPEVRDLIQSIESNE